MIARLKWAIRTFVRKMLRATPDNHAIRRAHRRLREVPAINRLWRKLEGGAGWEWIDPASYAAAGGVFARSVSTSPAPPARSPGGFGDISYFRQLLSACREDAAPFSADPVTVVIVNSGLGPGGAERQIVATAAGLRARGRKPIFVGPYLNEAPAQNFYLSELTDAGVLARSLGRRRAIGPRLYERVSRATAGLLAGAPHEMLVDILTMADVFRESRPRVAHLWQDETAITYAVSAIIAGVPRIVLSARSVNPSNFQFHRDWMKPAYLALLEDPRVALTNNSDAGARSYADWLGIEKQQITVIRNGFDTRRQGRNEAAANALRARLGISRDQKVASGVLRFSSEKRPLLWVEAAAIASRAAPDAHFILAGDGPMRAEVNHAVQAGGLAGRFTLLGETRAIADLLSASDAFMLTSENEGSPNVVIEAQWYGTPVLTTNVGGAPEAVLEGRTGVVSKSDAPEALGASLARLLGDEALRNAAFADGPNFVRERFGLDRMIDETLRIYGWSAP